MPMSGTDVNCTLRVSRDLPQAYPDTQQVITRGSRFGDLFVQGLWPGKQSLVDEGSYFLYTNPTPGTGIAMTISTSFSDTVAMFAIKNTSNPASGRRIYLDYLRLILAGTAPTAVLARHFAAKRSKATDREPTTAANKTVLTGVNLAGAVTRGPVARVLSYSAAAAMTVPASVASDEVVGRWVVPTGLGITHDQYTIRFGGEDHAGVAPLTAVRATHPAALGTFAPPIVVDPGEWLVIHEWAPTEATNGPTFEFELGLIER